MKKILRFFKLQSYKVIRIKDFPESVAIGLAWGAAISVTPALGLHLIVCYIGTWVMRGNLIAATVGTGNSAGMITGITVNSGGTGYNAQFPPTIKVGIATGYTDLSVTGGSGDGLKVDALIGSGGTVIGFDLKNRGFGYKNGEVLTVQGIPFRVGVSTSPFTLTVKSTIDDKFAGFSFGQLVPLDDFSSEFNVPPSI